uniref:Uncharacterized protein n=1 Tax=Opuntia streptacantha TaxID=393608 RepID=A0A7C9A2S4_OPUST
MMVPMFDGLVTRCSHTKVCRRTSILVEITIIFCRRDWTALSLDTLSFRVSGRVSCISPSISLTNFSKPSLTNKSILSPWHSGCSLPVVLDSNSIERILDVTETLPPVRRAAEGIPRGGVALVGRVDTESTYSPHSSSAPVLTQESQPFVNGK